MSRLIAIVLLTVPVVAWSQPAPAAALGVPAVLTVPEGFGVSVFASGLTGARLMEVMTEAGIPWSCVRTWEGGRQQERRLKRRRNAPQLCPVCRGRAGQ